MIILARGNIVPDLKVYIMTVRDKFREYELWNIEVLFRGRLSQTTLNLNLSKWFPDMYLSQQIVSRLVLSSVGFWNHTCSQYLPKKNISLPDSVGTPYFHVNRICKDFSAIFVAIYILSKLHIFYRQ